MPEPLHPAVWELPGMRVALARRDIAAVYRLLTDSGVTQRRIAEVTGMGASEVSEILADRQVQSVVVLERIADGLGVPRGWLGLAHDPPVGLGTDAEEVTEDMKRRHFLAAASIALWGHPVLGELLELPTRPETPTPLPSRLGMSDVDALRALTEQLQAVSRTYGGYAEGLSPVAARSERLLAVPAAEPVKRSLASALAELHTVAGWAGFDAHLDDAARHHFTRAVELAAQADDAYSGALALYLAGVLNEERRHSDDALKLFQLGQVRLADAHDDSRVPSLAAWLHADLAGALVHMGRHDAARTALDAAHDAWQPSSPEDEAELSFVAALVERDLGRVEVAEELAGSAVRLRTGTPDRRAAVVERITWAQLHVQAGERDGLTLAEQAIRGVAELRSQRARERLAPLADALAARPGSESRELAAHARRVAGARV